jgi:ferric-dicitrate binding protein FerR (iron transport regulator)
VTAPRYARLAARLLAHEQDSAPPPAVDPDARARAVAALELAIARQARRRRQLRWAGALSVAASVALVAVSGWRLGRASSTVASVSATSVPAVAVVRAPARDEIKIIAHAPAAGASVFVSGAAAPLDDGRALLAGSRIVTPPDGRADLAFSTGTEVALRGGTDTTLGGDDVTQVVRLDAGEIALHVAKLAADRRFEVRTPDAEVEVRGTRFTVAIAPAGECGDGTVTRVEVTEGVVAVRYQGAEVRVAAGQQWPSGCAAQAAPAVRTAVVAHRAPPSSPGAARRAAVVAAPASTLSEQNDRFAEAVTAKRHGDTQAAIGAFDRFLASYPSSALAESASLERMRLLVVADPSRAAAAARDYLARYPDGAARAEAEAIVAGAR